VIRGVNRILYLGDPGRRKKKSRRREKSTVGGVIKREIKDKKKVSKKKARKIGRDACKSAKVQGERI